MTNCVLQTDVLLSKHAALCTASDDILLRADDGHRAIYKVQLEIVGVTIKGKSRKLVKYPEGAYCLESMTASNAPDVYFTAAKSGQCNGGLYCCSMETGRVMAILENMINSSKKIKKVAKFNDTLVGFTDIEARQVNRYNPLTKKVRAVQYSQIDSVGVSTDKKSLHWYEWYDWYH